MITNYLVFGDSVAYGTLDPQGGWVVRLKNYLTKKSLPRYRKTKTPKDVNLVYNLGRSGDAIEGLLGRFESEVKHRHPNYRETLLIFQIGTNDCYLDSSTNKTRTNPKLFKTRLQKLIKLARKYSNNVVFLTLTPVDENKTIPIPWRKTQIYTNKNIKEYNQIIKDVCGENKIAYLDMFKRFKKENYIKLLEDGLHPNSEGHELIYQTVKNSLSETSVI